MKIDLYKKVGNQYQGFVIYKDDLKSVWDGITYPSEDQAKTELSFSAQKGYHIQKVFFNHYEK